MLFEEVLQGESVNETAPFESVHRYTSAAADPEKISVEMTNPKLYAGRFIKEIDCLFIISPNNKFKATKFFRLASRVLSDSDQKAILVY